MSPLPLLDDPNKSPLGLLIFIMVSYAAPVFTWSSRMARPPLPRPERPSDVMTPRRSRKAVGLENSRRWRRRLGPGEGRSETGLGSEYDECLFPRGIFAAK